SQLAVATGRLAWQLHQLTNLFTEVWILVDLLQERCRLKRCLWWCVHLVGMDRLTRRRRRWLLMVWVEKCGKLVRVHHRSKRQSSGRWFVDKPVIGDHHRVWRWLRRKQKRFRRMPSLSLLLKLLFDLFS